MIHNNINKMFINSVIFLIIWGFTLTVGQYEGDPCIAERTNSNGICKLITKCPSVARDIRNRRHHTRCGFDGNLEIVCCPVKMSTTPSPASNCSATANERLHIQKCKEYKSAVYDYVYSTVLSFGAERKRIPIDKCGHKQIPLIVGGTLANPREFPHMALVGYDAGNNETNWACGGTLISDRYVLTAGHCLYSREFGEPKYVRLGELNLNSETDDARPEDFNIEKIIPHPDWQISIKYNDIALLKLDRNVNLSPYKRPACLPIEFDVPTKRCIATGWGNTKWAGSGSSYLQKVILEKFNHAECNETYSIQINRRFRDGIRDETQICAGSKTDNKDTCQGDSGGPLQVYHHCEYCMYTIIGVTSFGITCGNVGVPGVYTRVFPYVDWIEKTVWKS